MQCNKIVKIVKHVTSLQWRCVHHPTVTLPLNCAYPYKNYIKAVENYFFKCTQFLKVKTTFKKQHIKLQNTL